MKKSLLLLFLPVLLLFGSWIQADSTKSTSDPQRIAPKEPAESQKAFQIQEGFRVELVAAEPLVMSPMAAEFDEDGRLFVVELPEYNEYGSKNRHGKGRVVVLEDTNKDGKFDKRTVYIDNLDYPTAVFPWDGGILVGAAPDLFYFKDTDGDGKADVKELILTGFGKDRAGEGQLNSFRWHLENRILISTGLDGGEIVPGNDLGAKPINVRSMNILLDPRTRKFEITSGGGQHGMSMDDWGHVFVSGNSDPIHLLMYDARYLAENPHLQAPPAAINILPSGKFTKLHRISAIEPWRILRTKLRKEGTIEGSDEGGEPSGFFTGATGVTIYRGDAYPEEYRGNAFIGEVSNNLVFRAKLTPEGIGFKAERADKDREFLASKDVWFRPVQFTHGPDGCLYVIDMYRELIEGAAFLAPQVLKNVDPSAGYDKGRIWRIVPKDFKHSGWPKLSKAPSLELVKLLEHPNGWHRDTASRLLHQRQDLKIVDELRTLAHESRSPLGRVHGLWALRGLGELEASDWIRRIPDHDMNVRKHAIRLAEKPRYDLTPFRNPDYFLNYPSIALQLAWSWSILDDWGDCELLMAILKRYGSDPLIRTAVLAGLKSSKTRGDLLTRLSKSDQKAFRNSDAMRTVLATLSQSISEDPKANNVFNLMRFLSKLEEDESGLKRDLTRSLMLRASNATKAEMAKFKDFLLATDPVADTIKIIRNEKEKLEERVKAIRFLSSRTLPETIVILKECLKPDQPLSIQTAAIETLANFKTEEVPGILIDAWPKMSPQARLTALESLLSRPGWIRLFLVAVEREQIKRTDIDPARMVTLRRTAEPVVRQGIDLIFGKEFTTKRQEIIDKYQPSLKLKGDSSKGKTIFKNECSTCHQLDGVGNNIGADLKAIKDRGLEGVLLNILDPNREVKPQFMTYTINLKDGKTLTGMIVSESANGLNLRKPDNTNESILRIDIESMKSAGISFMPEGLEKQIDLQAMADLLAYLSSVK